MSAFLPTTLAIFFVGMSPAVGFDFLRPKTKPAPVKAQERNASKSKKDDKSEPRVMTVRVTVYWKNGSGTDAWTANGKSSTGKPLRDRKSAAVDPKIIPYGSKIVLPQAGKSLDAVDTGSAVKSRKAARAYGRDVPVVDVFFNNKSEALRWARMVPMFMEAHVYEASEAGEAGGN